MEEIRIDADFNGLFGDLLCLSHQDVVHDEAGNPVRLRGGMRVVAFESDPDENGDPDELLANGIVEPSPDWLACSGSKWCLRIDSRGVRHRSSE